MATARAKGLNEGQQDRQSKKQNPLNHAVSMKYKPASHKMKKLSCAVFLLLLNCKNRADTLIHKEKEKSLLDDLKFFIFKRIIFEAQLSDSSGLSCPTRESGELLFFSTQKYK